MEICLVVSLVVPRRPGGCRHHPGMSATSDKSAPNNLACFCSGKHQRHIMLPHTT
jgi:hypothetical protein